MGETSPTRMNYLLLKTRKDLSEKGLELLSGKREALVRELLNVSGTVLGRRERLKTVMREGVTALSVAIGLDGRWSVESAAMAAGRDLYISLEEKNVWGVRFPEIYYPSVLRAADSRNYSFAGVSSHTGNAARQFERVLEEILRIASVEVRLKKIGAEIKKTTRRRNAISDILLPGIKGKLREIRLSLEEREREEIFRIKRFKKRAFRVGMVG